MSDIAIKVENLSKYYNLGVINTGTLNRDFQSWLWRKMGKEDPNKKIGLHEDNADGFWALKDLNFEIKKGERVGIIGKNGAGKSTLLKMLSQISAPTEGRIYINGKVASLLEVGTGFNPELTGRENIYLNGAILGMKKREVDRKIDEIIAFSEIERHIDTPVKRYSSGMYVRLAFAVAAHLDSDILIADEVLAVGDAAFQKKALGKMNELSSGQGRTVLFVSHNMLAVRNLCNKGILISKGKIECLGDLYKCIDIYSGGINRANTENLLHLDVIQQDKDVLEISDYSVVDKNCNILGPELNNTSDVYVLIHGNITGIDKNLLVFVAIYDKDKNIVWVNDLYENGNLTPTDLKIGKVEIKMKLPIEYLMAGKYSISVSAVIHYKKWLVNYDDNMMNFVINKPDTHHPVYVFDNHPMTGNRKPGILDINMPVEMRFV